MKERKGIEMIKDVPLTAIFVNDQDAARFSCNRNRMNSKSFRKASYDDSVIRILWEEFRKEDWPRCCATP